MSRGSRGAGRRAGLGLPPPGGRLSDPGVRVVAAVRGREEFEGSYEVCLHPVVSIHHGELRTQADVRRALAQEAIRWLEQVLDDPQTLAEVVDFECLELRRDEGGLRVAGRGRL